MNAVEKLEKILRRLRRKNRRAATRHLHKQSSSVSDEDNLPALQTDNSKNDHKSGSNSRAHLKPIKPSGTTTTVTRQPSEQLERARNLQQQQKQQHNDQKSNQDGQPKMTEIPDVKILGSNNNEAFTFKPPLSSSNYLNNPAFPDDLVTPKVANHTTHDKSCESEDADCVSDCSTYGLQRGATQKSVYELDMSVDESLAESCGRESGYLSGIDMRHSISTTESPALSPLGVAYFRAQPLFQRTLGAVTQQPSESDELKKKEQGHPQAITIPPQIGRITDVKLQHEEATIPDYVSTEQLLQDSIVETKYITTIFEFSSGGIVDLIDDVLKEFSLWFSEETGLLGIACEVQWSVPEKYRHFASEKRMIGALHHSLRQNNRRILNMKSRHGNYLLPLTMTSAVTKENCARNCQLNCFQGVYRRFYTSLLPYQHKDASVWHTPYWSLRDTGRQNPEKPNPEQFIFGRDPTKLDLGSLIAVNVVALKIAL